MRLTHSTAFRGLAVVTTGTALFAAAMLGTTPAANASVDQPARSAPARQATDLGYPPAADGSTPKSHATPLAELSPAEGQDTEATPEANEESTPKAHDDATPEANEEATSEAEEESTSESDEQATSESDVESTPEASEEATPGMGDESEDASASTGSSGGHDGKKDGKEHGKHGKKHGKKDHHGRKHHHCGSYGSDSDGPMSAVDSGTGSSYGHSSDQQMPQGSVESGRGGAALAAEQSSTMPISLAVVAVLMLGVGAWTLFAVRRLAGRSVR